MRTPITIERWVEILCRNKPGSPLSPPYDKQLELIHYLFSPNPKNELRQVDLCCGRGWGKSIAAIVIATMALSCSSNEVGLFLEPDWRRVQRVFLRKWQNLVPKHFYEHHKGEQLITWLPTGSILYYGPRNITGSLEASADGQLGIDTSFVIDDEAALRCSEDFYLNTALTVRQPGVCRFYLTLSTPRIGPYQRMVTAPGHRLFRGRSTDNPHLPPGFIERLRAQMGVEQARREIDGEFIALEGRIWKHAKYDPDPKNKEAAWPNGNRHDTWTKFRPDEPWWLFCDIGSATGAFAVVQHAPATYRGRELFNDGVWVAVADLCPYQDASASRAFQRLREEFGTPVAVVGGADIQTAASTDGRTVAYFARNVWGQGVRVIPCNERKLNKAFQYDRLSYLLRSANGERRFAIARDFVSLDDRSNRGVREMIQEDAWPAEDKRRPSDFLPKGKDNKVQHIRDALMMGAASIMSPPLWLKDDNPAA